MRLNQQVKINLKTSVTRWIAASICFPLLMAPVSAATNFSSSDALGLVQKHVQAQANFDQKSLEAVTHSQYVEVSPAGEVDERAKMLGFYAPENRKQIPTVEILEPVFRELPEAKLVIAKLRYKMQVGEQSRQFSIRASYLLCKEKQDWKICSAQYTGIR
ncbi:DUF4440 domain-containing protein [Undibacterium fentianense]|uniref:Nuclear transport factor 2 family protein n=1 Tax=Undibacterium fentianense TaxID=2828728 RepID=A0A941E6R4_9BURK|nr:DUF4440 domain-containing protein [Undibacterium fentianense]MBR7801584.1 nuclear transport factor 2 family protein [Undibacterium fentianense]